MRGWRSARAKARARDDAAAAAPVDALVVAADDAPAEAPAEAPESPPAGSPAEAPVPAVPEAAGVPAETQAELLRLFEVVTSMCDHVIEYIEADRAERRLMLETLTQLGRTITDGAANAVAAASGPPIAPRVTGPVAAPAESRAASFGFAGHERVIGGSMPAGPEPVIDLVDPDPEPAPAAQPEFAGLPTPSADSPRASTEIAVEVRGRFGDRWVDGFEICEVMTTPEGPRYRLRRRRDGAVLPELFDASNIRHVETFDQLDGARLNTAGADDVRVSPPAGYWTRS